MDIVKVNHQFERADHVGVYTVDNNGQTGHDATIGCMIVFHRGFVEITLPDRKNHYRVVVISGQNQFIQDFPGEPITNNLPDPKNPKPGDKFTGRPTSGGTYTVVATDDKDVWVRNDMGFNYVYGRKTVSQWIPVRLLIITEPVILYEKFSSAGTYFSSLQTKHSNTGRIICLNTNGTWKQAQ